MTAAADRAIIAIVSFSLIGLMGACALMGVP
ncbi:hypothetical protein J2129_002739 [Methanofollis sp. W23]|nr:hypothetical protein [Methanofollis sp. W23]